MSLALTLLTQRGRVPTDPLVRHHGHWHGGPQHLLQPQHQGLGGRQDQRPATTAATSIATANKQRQQL